MRNVLFTISSLLLAMVCLQAIGATPDSVDWQATWIGGDVDLVRKEFDLGGKTVSKATAYVTGLGYYELHINGKKTSDHVLAPGETKTRWKRGYGNAKRALYARLDVTNQLVPGKNAVGIMLGNGMRALVNNSGDRTKPPKMLDAKDNAWDRLALFQLEITFDDGTKRRITSDSTWKGNTDGPIVETDVFKGETYDARKESDWTLPTYDDSAWPTVSDMSDYGNGFTLTEQKVFMKVQEVIQPIKIAAIGDGKHLAYFAKKIGGWPRLTVSGPSGTKITLRSSAYLNEDGTFGEKHSKNTDVYILKGDWIEMWEPRFTYHGFRFVEISGFPGTPTPENIQAVDVYDDVNNRSSFSCSDRDITDIVNDLYLHWQKLNLKSVPVDTIIRDERFGWTGDAQVTAEGCMLMLDVKDYFEKWFRDMDDCQADNGRACDVVPNNHHSAKDHLAWKGARIIMPWEHYLYYGDKSVLQRHYGKMKQFCQWLQTIDNDDYTMPAEYSPYGGDHGNGSADLEQLATAHYYRLITLFARIADELGETSDRDAYQELGRKIKRSFNQRFLIDSDHYTGNTQADNAIPLHFGLVPAEAQDAVLKNLLYGPAGIVTRGSQKVGILGKRSLWEVLREHGQFDAAYRAFVTTDGAHQQCWKLMLEKDRSPTGANITHVMLIAGAPQYAFKAIAGIVVTKPGFAEFNIKPLDVENISWANGCVDSIRGPIRSQWNRPTETSLELTVEKPADCTAIVHVPTLGRSADSVTITAGASVIWRDGTATDCPAGITFLKTEGNYVVYRYTATGTITITCNAAR